MSSCPPRRRLRSNFITHFLTIGRRSNHHEESDNPPTPPPKDFVTLDTATRTRSKPLPIPLDEYIDEKAVYKFNDIDGSTVPQSPSRVASAPPRELTSFPYRPYVHIAPLAPLTPEEKERRRLALQRQRELEQEEALREERARQELRRLQKEEQERREREEEERRRTLLQEHIRYAAARRVEKEMQEKQNEEQRLEQIRQQKQIAHERRLHHTRELEQWRHEQIQRVISSSSEKEDERKRSTEERRTRIAKLDEALLRDTSPHATQGWVTIQTPDLLAWRRRYYKFDLSRGQMLLFPNHVDTACPIDTVELDGRAEGLYEWYEGFEELETISHSFAVKFIDGQSWFMYADEEAEKDKLLLWLSEAAGIII
ncbi:hypothetical protein SCLCIDRAFT_17376 [Scleroderma citrinum Foug A]|uniref:PH domain-containing protein n=1 Tax=Scleroderma citrinum Foug A TaxID=1036808 RepID=A0A0C2Z0S9_9AGAM|nr:hypothetical protein SCLCIDRAFT_17376 [Scleroderma citrinum Foug A]